jgi:hypothetical protein
MVGCAAYEELHLQALVRLRETKERMMHHAHMRNGGR